MLQALTDYWEALAAGGGVLGTAATYVLSVVRRVNRLDRDKIDRTEVVRMFELVRSDIKEIDGKLDDTVRTQHAINLQLTNIRRENGKH